jgi:uncharacterized protein (TIGR03067 family)
MNLPLIVGIITVALAARPAATDARELYGTWAFKSGTMNGETITLPKRMLWRFTFGRDNKLLIRKTGYPDVLGRFTTVPGKPTNAIDVTLAEEDGKSETGAGIYELNGDSLSLAMPVSNPRNRPADLKVTKGVFNLRLARQKPGPDDEGAAWKPSPRLTPAARNSRLAGRWELVGEKKAEKGASERIEVDFLIKEKVLIVRRETTTPLIGELKLAGNTEVRLAMVFSEGRGKEAIGIVEAVDKKKAQARVRYIRFNFQGDILELAGELPHTTIGAINLTGSWKRAAEKQ